MIVPDRSGPTVFGPIVDEQTRCVHWHCALDVVAIKFACCRRFYPCFDCHAETADHRASTWPASATHERAVLCGVCRRELTIGEYLAAGDACPRCETGFNPGCRAHRRLYFDSQEG